MLLENMQRSDLTVYEQAQGFQMMLDLGDTVGSISQQTGFSDTTIRRRVKLLELDADKFKESGARGATLDDYLKLEQIEDIEVRNKVLESIGTNNFNNKLAGAMDTQKRQKDFEKLLEKVREFATELTDPDEIGSKYNRKYIYPSDKNIKPDDAGTVKYYFTFPEYRSYINLLVDKPLEADKKTTNAEKERKEREDRKNALWDVCKRAYQLRRDYVLGLSNKEISLASIEIMAKAVEAMIHSSYKDFEMEDLGKDLGVKTDDIESVKTAIILKPERALLITTWNIIDGASLYCHDWEGKYDEDDAKDLLEVYEFMKKLMYKISDEEQSLIDGTHVLYSSKPLPQEEKDIAKGCSNCRYQHDSEAGKCGKACGIVFKNWEQVEDDEDDTDEDDE